MEEVHMKWPQIPAALATPGEDGTYDLSGISTDDLRAFRAAVAAEAKPVLEASPTAEFMAEYAPYQAAYRLAKTEMAVRATAAAGLEELSDDPEDVPAEVETDEEVEVEPPVEITEDEETAADDEDLATVGADSIKDKGIAFHTGKGGPERNPNVRKGLGGGSRSDDGRKVEPDILRKKRGAPGYSGDGDTFADWREVAQAMLDAADGMDPGSDTRHRIAGIPGRFAKGRILGDNSFFNLQQFQPEEVMAAMCAPLIPVYDLACQNTTRRPVAASLPAWRLDARGGVTIYPSPSLDDITGGTGIWTREDDADAEAVKNACQLIECATPEEFVIYAVYRCLTVKNLLAMTFPELLEAYLNRLAAAQARLAEVQLLEAMATATDTITGQELGYNATTRITSTILNYLLLYAEQQRWDVNGLMEAWMPRWVLKAIQMDLVRRRRTDGGFNMVPSEAQVTQLFRDAGVNPHFFIDRPSWATALPTLQTSGLMNNPPRNLEMIVAPPGKLTMMDRGELTVGVSGNNIYRLEDDLMRNQFTFFFENFEGVVNTNTCPAHLIEMNNLCYNGQQIADVYIDCEGGDYPGIAS
jgi:hypothetical protein